MKAIPSFKNEDEEQRFWDTHDSTEYIDWSKAEPLDLPIIVIGKSSQGTSATNTIKVSF